LQSFLLHFFFQKEFLRKQGQDLARQDARQDFADDLIFARKFVTACLAAGAGASRHLAARDCMLDIMMLGTVDEEERKEEHDEQLSLSLFLSLSLSSSELVMEW
jgi:hypothetical protein